MYIIDYNPFFKKTEIWRDRTKTSDEEFNTLKNKRFDEIAKNIPIAFYDDCNLAEIEIVLLGRTYEYEDLKHACLRYENQKGIKSKFILKHKKKYDNISTDKIRDLILALKESPIDKLRDEKLINKALRTLNNEFEIAVVATVSSGKSTLINAMIGESLLPAKNEATTAKIYRIKDVDHKSSFEMICHFNNGQDSTQPITCSMESLQDCNEDKNIRTIDLIGNIRGVSSEISNLVLIDTPGPNNAQNDTHREVLYNLINNEKNNHPMILFVLNATNMGLDSDALMLSKISEAIGRKNNEQTRERFIFVVNKVDEQEEDEINNTIKKVKEYLRTFHINDPIIFLVSAERGLIMRKLLNGLGLTKKEKQKENSIIFLAQEPEEYEYSYLEQYAPLHDHDKEIMNMTIQNAKENGNWQLKALYHSGIPGLEKMIDDYVTKYAVPMKLQEAFQSIEKIINSEELQNNFLKELQSNKIERDKVNQAIQSVTTILTNKESIEEIKKKIDELKIDPKLIKQKRLAVEEEFGKLEKENVFKEDIPPALARIAVESVDGKIKEIKASIHSDINRQVNGVLKESADSIREEFDNQIKKAFENFSEVVGTFAPREIFLLETTNITESTKTSRKTKEVEKTRQVERKKDFWDRIFIGRWRKKTVDEKYIEEEVYTVELSDAEQLKNQLFEIKRDFLKEIGAAEKSAEENLNNYKNIINKTIDSTRREFAKYAEDLKSLTSNQSGLDKKIAKINKEKDWLTKYEKQKAEAFIQII